jgi:hypothetical protein
VAETADLFMAVAADFFGLADESDVLTGDHQQDEPVRAVFVTSPRSLPCCGLRGLGSTGHYLNFDLRGRAAALGLQERTNISGPLRRRYPAHGRGLVG